MRDDLALLVLLVTLLPLLGMLDDVVELSEEDADNCLSLSFSAGTALVKLEISLQDQTSRMIHGANLPGCEQFLFWAVILERVTAEAVIVWSMSFLITCSWRVGNSEVF